MTKSGWKKWLCTVTATMGMGSLAVAGGNGFINTDSVFGENGNNIRLVSDACASDPCTADPCAPANCCPSITDSCDGCGGCGLLGGDGFDLGNKLFAEDSGWDLGGWMSIGYHSANDGVFNTYPGHVQMHQLNVYVEKKADGSNGLGFGGRMDLMYGTDASNTQSFGNNPQNFDFAGAWNHGQYGWAIPQLYAEVAYKDLSVKVGHFYTLLGYQVVPSTGNFFYSIPYTFNFGEAFTHTGALATYKASDKVTVYGGYTLGWDTGFDQRFGGSSFLGGISVAATDKITATYIATAGDLGWIGDGYSHSLVVDYKINDKWEYVFQTDYDTMDSSVNAQFNPFPAGSGSYDAVGINQYLFYTVNEKWKLGGRLEWWKANGESINEMALGVNYKPIKNLTIRPEVRYNWVPGSVAPGAFSQGPLPVGTSAIGNASNNTVANDYNDNFIFGIDAVFTF